MGGCARLLQPAVMDTSKPGQPRPAGGIIRATPNRGSPERARPHGLLLTPVEYDAWVQELERLTEIRDRDLPALLRDARSFVAGDAAEEIIQIHEDQVVVDDRIRRLEGLLRSAHVIEDDLAPEVATLGRSVEVEYLRTGKVRTYRIAGIPAECGSGTVSAASPLGAALMGRSPDDIVAVELPGGRVEELRIIAVLRQAWAA